MKRMQLSAHWSPEEAHSMLTMFDELRDSIWNNYRDEIIEYCRQMSLQEQTSSIDIDDDIIPF